LFLIINYAVFSSTNQKTLINIFIIEKVFNILGNCAVHTSIIMRFLYSVIIHSVACLINVIITILIVIRMLNLIKLCALIDNHSISVKKPNDTKADCKLQVILYLSWIFLNVITLILKFIAMNYAYRSHLLLMKLYNRQKNKKNKKNKKS